MADRTASTRGGRRCRRTGCREPTCTPSSSRLPQTAADGRATTAPATAAPLLFPLSSTSADELRRTAGRLADWVDGTR